jgi:hypothetical protein
VLLELAAEGVFGDVWGQLASFWLTLTLARVTPAREGRGVSASILNEQSMHFEDDGRLLVGDCFLERTMSRSTVNGEARPPL